MNKQILKKIKSESGASLVLAILVFLICALVGSTILAAATASSGTLTTTSKNDKSTYTLISAEKLFVQSFDNKIWKAGDYSKIDSAGKIEDVPSLPTMNNLYQYLCVCTYNDGSASYSLIYTLNDDASTNVNVAVTMDDTYSINAVFTQTDSSRTVVLNLPGATATGTTTRTMGASVGWSNPSVTVK